MIPSQRSEARRAARAAAGKKVDKPANDRACKTLSVIARLLDAEGFNEHTANHVIRWVRQTQMGFNAEYVKAKSKFIPVARKLSSEEDRRILGKFISVQHAAGFYAGLKIGLMAHLTKDITGGQNDSRTTTESR